MKSQEMQIIKQSTILCIDDDHQVRSSLASMLKEFCHQVLQAESVEGAWKIYRSQNPDILIVDVHMSGKSGLEFLRGVRQYDHKTPAVILSAYSDPMKLLEAIPLQLEQYLIKPLSFDRLMEALEQCAQKIMRERNTLVRFGDQVVYNRSLYRIEGHGDYLDLGLKELDLLELLLEHPGEIVPYNTIAQVVWPDGDMTDTALKSLVNKLRSKVGKESIENHRGQGYKIITEKAGNKS